MLIKSYHFVTLFFLGLKDRTDIFNSETSDCIVEEVKSEVFNNFVFCRVILWLMRAVLRLSLAFKSFIELFALLFALNHLPDTLETLLSSSGELFCFWISFGFFNLPFLSWSHLVGVLFVAVSLVLFTGELTFTLSSFLIPEKLKI